MMSLAWRSRKEMGVTDHANLYVRVMRWVLEHLTPAPVDPEITVTSHRERIFAIVLSLCSLFVAAAGISSMAGTIAELRKWNSGFIETRRQLQSYLKRAQIPRELSMLVTLRAAWRGPAMRWSSASCLKA